MKRYTDLNPEQQKKAVEKETLSLLTAICEGALTFNDELNKDDLQARIDEAWKKAEARQTPWFIGEYIMDTCKNDIEGMAQCQAEDAFYLEDGEHCVSGVA